jgi:multiple sugar transport system permease protein
LKPETATNTTLKQNRANTKKLKGIFFHLIIAGLALVMLYPIIWLFMSSFKESSQVFATAESLIPKNWVWENYAIGWAGFAGNSFALFMKNSFIIAIASTIGVVISSALIAYGFARIKFPGKKIWFTCMMLSMMLPQEVVLIPQYLIFSKLGWINTFLPIIVPQWFGFPFFIFLMIQFIRTIPMDLDEAAKIDGCSKYGIFFRVILPLIKPALATSAIFSFYWRWDDLMGPLLYLNAPDLYTVSLGLKVFLDSQSTSLWGPMFAMSVVSLLPVLLTFFMFQKYIVEGISTNGLKG